VGCAAKSAADIFAAPVELAAGCALKAEESAPARSANAKTVFGNLPPCLGKSSLAAGL